MPTTPSQSTHPPPPFNASLPSLLWVSFFHRWAFIATRGGITFGTWQSADQTSKGMKHRQSNGQRMTSATTIPFGQMIDPEARQTLIGSGQIEGAWKHLIGGPEFNRYPLESPPSQPHGGGFARSSTAITGNITGTPDKTFHPNRRLHPLPREAGTPANKLTSAFECDTLAV